MSKEASAKMIVAPSAILNALVTVTARPEAIRSVVSLAITSEPNVGDTVAT